MTRNTVGLTWERWKFALKKLQSIIDTIQKRNAGVPEEEVMEDVTQAVEEVRQERFLESIRQASAHKSG
jgi:hypothetical protein